MWGTSPPMLLRNRPGVSDAPGDRETTSPGLLGGQ